MRCPWGEEQRSDAIVDAIAGIGSYVWSTPEKRPMNIEKVILDGTDVRLEPLAQHHLSPLARAIEDGELWKLPVTFVPHPNDLPSFFADAEQAFEHRRELAFATIDKRTAEVVGSTRFMNIEATHKRCEIGFTFIAERLQRSHVNTEAKYLMLCHAFQQWRVNRVELLTDVLNTKSRNAIGRIGGKQEGILRQHMIMRDGRVRDSVLFALVRTDWPEAKAELEAKLRAGSVGR